MVPLSLQLVWSARGISPCTCWPGRSHLQSPRATRWWQSPARWPLWPPGWCASWCSRQVGLQHPQCNSSSLSTQFKKSILTNLSVSAGVPPGVVNIVFGTGPRAGNALVGHPDVPLISFTGSTATAQRITERSAPYCKKLSLELGGKNPALVFADADLDKCIETTVRSSFSNQVRKSVGQCICLIIKSLKCSLRGTTLVSVIIS